MQEIVHHVPEGRGVVRVALMRGDEVLSRALVIPMTMRVGRATVRMDGIGGVETPEAHRNRGYARRVLEAAVRAMNAGDAAISTLYGIPHFYPRYGYATLGPEYELTPVSLHERNLLRDGYSARAGNAGDLPALKRLYREETAGAYGALVRDDDWWTWTELAKSLTDGAGEVRVVERGGQVVGYAWRGSFGWWMEQWTERAPHGLKVAEAFAADAAAAEMVLAACRRWATDLGDEQVTLGVPPECRVGTALRLQNATMVERWWDEGEFMGRSTGLASLLRSLAPEMEARWQVVSAAMLPFAITIVTEGERVTVSGGPDGIEVASGADGGIEVSLDPGTVARLALGGFDPQGILQRASVTAAAIPILSALFPRHVPYIYPVDRF
jgi:hypothetical protein